MDTASINESRRERKERTRQAILEAALRLLDQQSFAQLSLRQIAREVGIVPTAFYRHFASLEELGLTLVDESFSTLREMIRAARDDMDAYESVIQRSVQVLVEHVHAHRSHFAFVARERFGGNAAVRAAIRRELALFSHELANDLARLPNLRSWRPEDVKVLSDLIVNAMVSTAMLLLAVDGPAEERQIIEDARKQLRLIVVGVSGWQPA